MSASKHDVIIVGARPAGAATAMLLGHAGLDVLVVDRATNGDDAPSIGRLLPGAVVQLDRWGLLPRLDAARTPHLHRAILEVDGRREQQWLAEPLLAPRRTVLDPILVGSARYAGADVRYGVTVDAVEPGRDGRVGGVVGRSADGGRFRAEARLTVGADGLHSRIARLVGAPSLHRGTSASAVAYRYVARGQLEGYHRIFRQGTTAGVVATNRGKACVWVGAPAARLHAAGGVGDEAWFRRTLEHAAPNLAEQVASVPAGPLTVFRGESSLLRQPSGPGWALVGDAGAFTDPASGHGIAAALRDAELLAEAIVATVRDGDDERTAMRHYRNERDRLTRPILEATDAIAAYDWDGHQPHRHLDALDAALTAEANFLRDRDPSPVEQADTNHRLPAQRGVLTTARTTSDLASIVIEAETIARYAEIEGRSSDRTTSAAQSYRRWLPGAWETASEARGLLHELLDHEYELLCAIESELS